VRVARAWRDVSQTRLAHLVGSKLWQISLIERGLPPTPEQVVAIAKALEIDPADLTGGDLLGSRRSRADGVPIAINSEAG